MAAAILACAAAVVAQTPLEGFWASDRSDQMPGSPYIIELKSTAGKTSGTIRQTGGPVPGPVDLWDVKVTAKEMSFNAWSPDGDRLVSFQGTITGDTIALKKQVKVRDGGSPGGAGLFGAAGVQAFTVKRQPPPPRPAAQR